VDSRGRVGRGTVCLSEACRYDDATEDDEIPAARRAGPWRGPAARRQSQMPCQVAHPDAIETLLALPDAQQGPTGPRFLPFAMNPGPTPLPHYSGASDDMIRLAQYQAEERERLPAEYLTLATERQVNVGISPSHTLGFPMPTGNR
jgi:hypothetical protein